MCRPTFVTEHKVKLAPAAMLQHARHSGRSKPRLPMHVKPFEAEGLWFGLLQMPDM